MKKLLFLGLLLLAHLATQAQQFPLPAYSKPSTGGGSGGPTTWDQVGAKPNSFISSVPQVQGLADSLAKYAKKIPGKDFSTNDYTAADKAKVNKVDSIIAAVGTASVARGQAELSGDGITTTFRIPHGLGAEPATISADAANDAAAGITNRTADATWITINYPVAPPAGTKNVLVYWQAWPNASAGGGSGGKLSFDGDGATATFSIPHGLGKVPGTITVDSESDAAAGITGKTADATFINFSFPVAPPAGTKNVTVWWSARP